jgi:hypothetical protein
MQSPFRPTALLLLGFLAASSGVGAQTQVSTSLPEPPPVAGWVFTPALGVGASWNDNVLLAHPGDEPPADYATPIRPSLTLTYLGRRTQFSSGYEGSILIYRTLQELNSFEHAFRAGFEHRLTPRITVFAKEEFARAPTTDALLLAGVPFYYIGSRTNAAGGGALAALTKHTSLRAGYTMRTVRFDFDERIGRELRGGYAHELAVALERAVSARIKLVGDYDLVRGTVGDTRMTTEPRDEFNIQTGRLTVLYQVSPTVDVAGGFGVSHLDGGPTREPRTAPAWQVGLTHRQRYAVWSASYQRSLVPSWGFGGTFQNEELVATVRVPFARNRAYADGGVSWFDADAIDAGQPSLRSTWVNAKLGYLATRWLRIEGYYSRAQQDSQRAGGQLGRNYVGVQVVTSKPLRIR